MTTAFTDESLVASGLTLIVAALEKLNVPLASGMLGGHYGYGAIYENDTFMMHPFCWCDADDCPWCAPCACPDSAWVYYIDDKVVSDDEYTDFYERELGPVPTGLSGSEWPAYEAQAEMVNARRRVEFTPECRWCLDPDAPRPNFLHKPSGSKVTWYKYIGRSMEITTWAPWPEIISDSLASLGAPSTGALENQPSA